MTEETSRPLPWSRTDEIRASPSPTGQGPGTAGEAGGPRVFVFNPFAEAFITSHKAFTPVKSQAMLAEDLANLPQFLCRPGDIVLLPKRPSPDFLHLLEQAGFPSPECVELRAGKIDPADGLVQRKLGCLQPWAWGPDSVELLEPLFQVASEARMATQYFNDKIALLYSKAWSATFLRTVLAQYRASYGAAEPWLCSEQEAGLAVATIEEALEAIAAIRRRGHHRVVVKQAYGLAGHNAIRLWEPEILPAQQRHLARALENGQLLIVEPWLDRALDFSIQLEMKPGVGLTLCGCTGLINDRKGQFLANWAEAGHRRCLPARVAALLGVEPGFSERLHRLHTEMFSLLETELQKAGFTGPISIDALIYRTLQGDYRLKPVVEINPRFTMGRLTVELMKHVCPGSCGLFRLVSRAQARSEGFDNLSSYANSLTKRFPLSFEVEPVRRIRQGALCLNDPERAQVCLATFEVSPTVADGWIGSQERREGE
ncbi:MAG: hypothetical protein AB9869_28195 [Verrucomicrobiia bacterium]